MILLLYFRECRQVDTTPRTCFREGDCPLGYSCLGYSEEVPKLRGDGRDGIGHVVNRR